MSKAFPTHKQFIAETRARLRAEYPDAAKNERGLLEDCVAMNTDTGAWLRHLGDLITKGVKAEVPVLDTLTADQLYSLRKIYAPLGALDWYIPARMRTHVGLDPIEDRDKMKINRRTLRLRALKQHLPLAKDEREAHLIRLEINQIMDAVCAETLP